MFSNDKIIIFIVISCLIMLPQVGGNYLSVVSARIGVTVMQRRTTYDSMIGDIFILP